MENESKKILVVAHIPTHPLISGSRMRLCCLLGELQKLGYEIYYIYNEKWTEGRIGKVADLKTMKEKWQKVYRVPLRSQEFKRFLKAKVKQPKELFERTLGRLGAFLQKHHLGLYNFLKQFKKPVKAERIDKNLNNADRYYHSDFDFLIKKLNKKNKFFAVISVYIHHSKAFAGFDDSVLKIIEAHDIFSAPAAKNIIERENLFCAQAEEAEALNRADVILTIQPDDEKYLSRLTKKKVVTIGHLADIHKPTLYLSGRKNILFIGSLYQPNIDGLNFFIKDVWPKVRLNFPEANFLIGGKVCLAVNGEPGVIKLGQIVDLEKIYNQADLVISPIFSGTGLKIKSIEALSFAKPLITTSFARGGLKDGQDESFLVADTAADFLAAIIKIFSDEKEYERLSLAAYEFMKIYQQKNKLALESIFK